MSANKKEELKKDEKNVPGMESNFIIFYVPMDSFDKNPSEI